MLKNITNLVDADSYEDTLLPLLLETGFLVPTGKKSVIKLDRMASANLVSENAPHRLRHSYPKNCYRSGIQHSYL
jgi:hypothetical protein